MTANREGPNDRAGLDAGPMLPLENQIARGLRFTHIVLMAIEQQNRETGALAQVLAQLLIARGLIEEEVWKAELERTRGIDIRPA